MARKPSKVRKKKKQLRDRKKALKAQIKEQAKAPSSRV